MLVPDLSVRLSVVYSEIWLDAQRVDLHSDLERTLSGTLDYVAGHLYQVDKDATILFTGGYFANNEMLSASFASICTARAVGIVKVIFHSCKTSYQRKRPPCGAGYCARDFNHTAVSPRRSNAAFLSAARALS
jgi:hypothetical protein